MIVEKKKRLSESSRSELMRPLSGAVIVEMTDPRQLIVCEHRAFIGWQLEIEFSLFALRSCLLRV